jgi:hypothetical protein
MSVAVIDAGSVDGTSCVFLPQTVSQQSFAAAEATGEFAWAQQQFGRCVLPSQVNAPAAMRPTKTARTADATRRVIKATVRPRPEHVKKGFLSLELPRAASEGCAEDRSATPANIRGVWASFHNALKRLLVSDIIIRSCEGMAEILIVLYATNVVGGLRKIGEPSRKAITVDVAEPHLRARSVGLYYLIRRLSITPAEATGGALNALTPRLPFVVAGARHQWRARVHGNR